MNTETEYLKSIAEEILINKSINTEKPDHHLQVEGKRLEKAILHSLSTIENFTQRDTFLFNTLSKLVNICDLLFAATESVNPDVMVLMDLMTAVRQVVPDELRPNLKLPKAFIALQQGTITETWMRHQDIIRSHGIGEGLIRIAGIPFLRFSETNTTLYWGDFTWLKGYIAKLEIVDWQDADCNSPEEALLSLLIGRDFNDDRFYVYCKKYIQARARKISGKRNKLLEFAECEKLVLQDTQIDMPSFDEHANSVSTRLIKLIREEIDFVETHEKEVPFSKLHFHLPGYKVSFLFKLLSEHKIFGDTPFKEVANQIASTCLSIDGEEIPAKSTVARAYPNDQKTIVEFAELFEKIAEYLRRFISKK